MSIESVEKGREARGNCHVFGEHVGEVLVDVYARSPRELFVQAGLALAELLAGEHLSEATGATEVCEVQARDREALLVAWLNELIARGEINRRVYAELKMEELDATHLRAQIRGFEPTQLRTAVKAATLHDLLIEPTTDGLHARLVLDV